MKYACTPTATRARVKKAKRSIPANERYLGPTSSEANTNICIMKPGIKNPTIALIKVKNQYAGEKAQAKDALRTIVAEM